MRTFVTIALTVIITSLALGLYGMLTRSKEATPVGPTMTELLVKLESLQRDTDNIVRRVQHSAWEHARTRSAVYDLRTEQAEIIRRSRDDFLRLLIEDRDNQHMYEVRRQIVDKIVGLAKQYKIGSAGSDCIRVAIDTQRRLYEIRRRLIPPDAMIVASGPWIPALNSELKTLRDEQYERFQELVGEQSAILLTRSLQDIQQLYSFEWDEDSPSKWRR